MSGPKNSGRSEPIEGRLFVSYSLCEVVTEGGETGEIKIVDIENRREVRKALSELKRMCRAQGQWKEFWKLKEEFVGFKHVYAQTIHKSQGSTYETAIVSRIGMNQKYADMYNRLLYTAVTRPTTLLMFVAGGKGAQQ